MKKKKIIIKFKNLNFEEQQKSLDIKWTDSFSHDLAAKNLTICRRSNEIEKKKKKIQKSKI